jgi:hypothetical protein
MRGGGDDYNDCDNDDDDDGDNSDDYAHAVNVCLRFSDATARWSVEPTTLKHPLNRSGFINADGDNGVDGDDNHSDYDDYDVVVSRRFMCRSLWFKV